MKIRNVFTFNANPDDEGKDLSIDTIDLGIPSDDDEDYNPGGYEAVFCLGNENFRWYVYALFASRRLLYTGEKLSALCYYEGSNTDVDF